MNYYDAQAVRQFEPYKRKHRWLGPNPMDVLCECGMRYGQHRHGDLACMNQKWSPGNGQVLG